MEAVAVTEPTTRKPRSALFRWLVWSPALVIVLSATAATGGLALFLLPLLGVSYAVFCLIAWQGPGEGVE